MFKTYKMKLIPLTPIHVGTGEFASPGEYFVFDDFIYFVELGLIPYEEFDKRGNLRKTLLKWIDENPITWVKNVEKNAELKELIIKHASFKCKATKEVRGSIRARWAKNLSDLEISLLHRTINSAIIPGSSIKGALRTALLWHQTKGKISNFQQKSSEVSKWERKVLLDDYSINGNIEDDLLRNLRISDAQLPPSISTYVLLPTHVGMSDKPQHMQDYKECIVKANYDKPYSINGSLTIDEEILRRRRMDRFLSADIILNSCRDFYNEVISVESNYWKDGDTPEDKTALQHCEKIIKFAESNKDGALIRLGWGSGINAVGLNLAKPDGKHPPRGINYDYYYPARTRILISGYPPGWAFLKLE